MPEVAYSRTILAAAVSLQTWSATWLGLVPLLGFSLRALLNWYRGDSPEDSLVQATALIAAGAGLRLCALPDVIAGWLPWLGLAWAPHLSWALGLAALWLPTGSACPPSADDGAADDRQAQVRRGGRLRSGPLTRPLLIGLVTALLYSAYTLYFCQLTMLHGDEGQYLRVTQSLLRDGDIDLSNNLDVEHTLEFHVTATEVHKAPASPEGKIHSVHPVGLSVLLMPAYQLGVQLGNPRLVCALFMALLTAACVSLLDEWLRRLGISAATAGWTTFIVATSAPLLFFSTQLYPEIPALLIGLVILVQLPVTSTPRLWTDLGTATRSPARLTGLAALLLPLPFLHPRYLPLAGLLGAAILWEAWRLPDRRRVLTAIGTVWLMGLAGLIAYNILYSGDWLGAIRPGNAWEKGALQPSTWLISLPGHWLHATKGLFTNAPVFALTFVAAGWMAWRRDLRLLVVLGLYVTTAMVNGLHPMWWFGFGLPARFLVTALPALAIALAIGLQEGRRRTLTLLLIAVACVIGWDFVLTATMTPEAAYEGHHLRLSWLMKFYPLLVHGVAAVEGMVPLADVLFWAVMTALGLTALAWRDQRARVVLICCILLWPGMWGRFVDIDSRMRLDWVPFLDILMADGRTGPSIIQSRLKANKQPEIGTRDGKIYEATGRMPGRLASYYLSVQEPGLLGVMTDSTSVRRDSRSRYIIRLRDALPAVQPWEERMLLPIRASEAGESRFHYISERQSLAYLDIAFAGEGDHLRLGTTSTEFRLIRVGVDTTPVEHFEMPDPEGRFLAVGRDLEQGRYRARFEIEGSTWSEWFRRSPASVRMAAFLTDPAADIATTRQGIAGWMEDARRPEILIGDPAVAIPQVDRLEAPWWTSLTPLIPTPYELTFHVSQPSRVWIVYQYEGEADLRLQSIQLDHESFRMPPAEEP